MTSLAQDENGGKLFSVVTVTRNDIDGLKRTARSISEQSNQEYQWVVVDGDSNDGTAEFLEDKQNILWISEKDGGIYDAMNKGVAMSSGEYVVFLNAGDVFPDADTLGTVARHIASQAADVDVVFGGANYVVRNGRRVYRGPHQIEGYIWHGLPANHQATYYRRERLLATPYDLNYRICGDYYIAAALFKEGIKVTYIDRPLADFSVGGTSYQNLRRVCLEPYRIQRDLLCSPPLWRVVSAARRVVSIAITKVL